MEAIEAEDHVGVEGAPAAPGGFLAAFHSDDEGGERARAEHEQAAPWPLSRSWTSRGLPRRRGQPTARVRGARRAALPRGRPSGRVGAAEGVAQLPATAHREGPLRRPRVPARLGRAALIGCSGYVRTYVRTVLTSDARAPPARPPRRSDATAAEAAAAAAAAAADAATAAAVDVAPSPADRLRRPAKHEKAARGADPARQALALKVRTRPGARAAGKRAARAANSCTDGPRVVCVEMHGGTRSWALFRGD